MRGIVRALGVLGGLLAVVGCGDDDAGSKATAGRHGGGAAGAAARAGNAGTGMAGKTNAGSGGSAGRAGANGGGSAGSGAQTEVGGTSNSGAGASGVGGSANGVGGSASGVGGSASGVGGSASGVGGSAGFVAATAGEAGQVDASGGASGEGGTPSEMGNGGAPAEAGAPGSGGLGGGLAGSSSGFAGSTQVGTGGSGAGVGGVSANGGVGGSGATAGSGAQAGGAAGAGGSNMCSSTGTGVPLDLGCVQASDCDRKIGPRGCGAWTCSLAGQCEVAIRCEDGDSDGLGVGPDCACTGVELDCDDGDPNVGESSSAACCNGGTRKCVAGTWALCSGATGEWCNGKDDDCNGAIDDIGPISCGVGACRNTVAACSNGKPGVCVPLAPTTSVDGCNGIDDDCDGAIDEDCPTCLHVAPDGDDAAALASSGASAFRNLQPALDFADAHRTVANRVCVAAGAACGASASYAGPAGSELIMRDGISVLGNYESTCWTRCTNSTTHLAPQTGRGVLFPAEVAIQTALDGFTIDRPYDATFVSGVTVDGARGVLLSNLTITGAQKSPAGGESPGEGYGVHLEHGAQASIIRDHIESAYATQNAAIHAVDSEVLVEDNCSGPTDPVTGRCASDCSGSGPRISGVADLYNRYTIVLDNSPGSRIERSTICARVAADIGGVDRAGISVTGDATGLVIRANTVGGTGYISADTAGNIVLRECGGAAPWISDNQTLGWTLMSDGTGDLVRAVGDCHPVIESNQVLRAEAGVVVAKGRAVSCVAGSVPSRCVIVNNPAITGLNETNLLGNWQLGAPAVGTGVYCDGGSCALVQNNAVTGMTTNIRCGVGGCWREGDGVIVNGGSARIEGNTISAGNASNMTGWSTFTRHGMTISAGNTIVKNRISGDVTGSALDFESNVVFGGAVSCSFSLCPAVRWNGGGTVKNNCIAGSGSTYPAFAEGGPSADPLVFTGNDLTAGANGTIYLDEGSTALTTAAAVNALTDMTVSGTLTSACSAPPVAP